MSATIAQAVSDEEINTKVSEAVASATDSAERDLEEFILRNREAIVARRQAARHRAVVRWFPWTFALLRMFKGHSRP